ncbi:MAG: FKBP-type peptidyl-prolyl cis-trans isomerase [Bacteroidales bacterium]|nr:FKBP-type peptidyl-prolyl cis-trans isomerase [Bacteroidales bacterium]
MKTSKLLILSLFILIAGCDKFSRYPGFKKARHGVYYQLHTMGEDTVKAHPGDYITVNLAYMTMSDSLFFQGSRKFQINKPAYEGAIDECFAMLSKDECATFIIDAGNFFTNTIRTDLPGFIARGSPMKIRVEMIEIQKEEEYKRQKEAFLSWIQDFGEYERVILQQYIREEKLNVNPLPSGIYYLNLVPGHGKKVELGDTLTVNYEGRFLNGKFFDSTIKRRQPFQFVYGTEWQVIKGLEEAIGLMSEGEKSLFILPSELGFGNQGSSNSIIPPFTSLIFEVEILKVSSPGKI